MRKLILFVHISLDGFVSGEKGELDGFEASEENLRFVTDKCKEADAALFGRISYQLLNAHWPTAKDKPDATRGEREYSNWYNNAEKIVFSRTMTGEGLKNTTIISKDVLTAITKIKEQAGKDIIIFGSPTVSQQLMELGLIDVYWVFINPVIFGKGKPLFAPLTNKLKLKLLETKQFANGELAINYSVNNQ